jgi:hypothetical protein
MSISHLTNTWRCQFKPNLPNNDTIFVEYYTLFKFLYCLFEFEVFNIE